MRAVIWTGYGPPCVRYHDLANLQQWRTQYIHSGVHTETRFGGCRHATVDPLWCSLCSAHRYVAIEVC